MFQHASSRMTAVDFVGLEIAQSGAKEWRTNATSVARSTRSPRHMAGLPAVALHWRQRRQFSARALHQRGRGDEPLDSPYRSSSG